MKFKFLFVFFSPFIMVPNVQKMSKGVYLYSNDIYIPNRVHFHIHVFVVCVVRVYIFFARSKIHTMFKKGERKKKHSTESQ